MAQTPWGVPRPQAIGGLNSVMVYGENLQVAVGLNHQIALGSNVQLCVNPMALVGLLGSPASEVYQNILGSGLGGNMQFTIGHSTNVIWGRQFTVNLGPANADVDIHAHPEKPLSRILAVCVGVVAVAHGILYGALPDDNQRAIEVIVFQVLMDVCLAAFMKAQMMDRAADTVLSDLLAELFTFPSMKDTTRSQKFEDLLEYGALLAIVSVPVITTALEEGHFAGDSQDSTQSS